MSAWIVIQRISGVRAAAPNELFGFVWLLTLSPIAVVLPRNIYSKFAAVQYPLANVVFAVGEDEAGVREPIM
jgi:hypothetical protein